MASSADGDAHLSQMVKCPILNTCQFFTEKLRLKVHSWLWKQKFDTIKGSETASQLRVASKFIFLSNWKIEDDFHCSKAKDSSINKKTINRQLVNWNLKKQTWIAQFIKTDNQSDTILKSFNFTVIFKWMVWSLNGVNGRIKIEY